jgi:prepilin-type N-terminal cleavage/methylation domain-containing protein
MQRFHQEQERSGGRRGGFTLVELMVVIAIILALVVLSAVVIGNVLRQSTEAKTRATLAKLSGQIEARRRGLDIYMQSPQGSTQVRMAQQRYGIANQQIAAGLFMKSALKEVLPVRIEYLPEAKQIAFLKLTLPTNATPAQINAAITAGISSFRSTSTAASESSEVLYFALTEGSVFGIAPVAPDFFQDSELADKDNDGRQEIIDGWGNPIRFYLYPTRLFRPGGTGTGTNNNLITLMVPKLSGKQLDIDPDDPTGEIARQYGANFAVDYHTPATYHVPLLVSAGEDGLLGLYEPNDTASGRQGYLGQPDPNQFVGNSYSNPLIDSSTLFDDLTSQQAASGD